MPDRLDPYKTLQVDSRGRGRGHPGRLSAARTQVPPGPCAGRPRRPTRMAAINAAWEPDRRSRRAPPVRRRPGDPRPRRRCRRSRLEHVAGRSRRPAGSGPPPKPDRHRRHRPAARRGVARLDVGPLVVRAAATTASMHEPDGLGAAGPPPGRPSGSVLNFGRYAGWSIGEIAPARTSSTSSGSTGRRSAASTARRSTSSCGETGRRRSRGRRGERPPRPVPPPLSRASVGAASDVRATSHPTVVPWTSSVNSTTPNVISWSSARCGTSAGGPAPSPRRPPHAGRPRTGRGASRSARARRGPAAAPAARRHRGGRRRRARGRRGCRRRPTRSGPSDATSRAGGMARPISRKTTAVSRNARNSQTVSIASAPVTLIVRPGPKLPRTTAATTVAMTPGQVELVGDQIAAVGEHDRDRQLEQVVVGRG